MPRPPVSAPSADEHAELLAQLGPLPITGAAWPRWVKLMAWIVLAVLALQIVRTATRLPPESVDSVMAGIVLLCFVGMAIVARHMQTSVTTIDQQGLRQSWITRREVAWDEIQVAKFVPMLLSKRLIVFTRNNRPLVFQGSTRELQTAFARISLVYRRR